MAATSDTPRPARRTAKPPRRSKGMSSEAVYQTLRREIIELELQPGAAIDDIAIGTRLGVSRQPIREAVIRLSAEGLVEANPRRTTIVAPFDLSSVRDSLDGLALLYRLTSRLAALHCSADQLAAIELTDLHHRQALRAGNVEEVIDCNREFHLRIAEAAGNAVFLGWTRNLLGHGERFMRLYLRQYDHVVGEDVLTGHTAILEGIRARDPAAADAGGERDAQILAEGLAIFFRKSGVRDFAMS